ncbi:MAG: thiamine-phosphate kinase, partial [Actinomycetota bacterium]
QLRPRARVAEAERLCAAGVTSMIDVSDGLALDLGRLMDASGTGCLVDPARIPVDPALEGLDLDAVPQELALSGGEDFELLFTIAEEAVDEARAALEPIGTALTRIGTVEGGGRFLGDSPLRRWEERGWDHLRDR